MSVWLWAMGVSVIALYALFLILAVFLYGALVGWATLKWIDLKVKVHIGRRFWLFWIKTRLALILSGIVLIVLVGGLALFGWSWANFNARDLESHSADAAVAVGAMVGLILGGMLSAVAGGALVRIPYDCYWGKVLTACEPVKEWSKRGSPAWGRGIRRSIAGMDARGCYVLIAWLHVFGPVGYMAFNRVKCHLHYVVTMEDWRSRGIAGRLWEDVKSRFDSEEITATPSTDEGRECLASWGFSDDGTGMWTWRKGERKGGGL